MDEPSTHHGRCLCGSVQFSFTGEPRFVSECVCESCRRAHGATAVAWIGVKTEQFRVERGEADLAWFRSSAPSERGYCKSCGTRLLFRSSKWPDEVHMALANMDAPHPFRSTGVSFKGEFPEWSALNVPRAD